MHHVTDTATRIPLTAFERVLRLVTIVRGGEGRAIALFGLHGFLVMAAYYLVKALRESFLLGESDAAVRSYAVAANGVILMLLVPVYSVVRRRIGNRRLVIGMSLAVAAILAAFLLAYPLRSGAWFGIAFFIWVGIFGLLVVSQFWALAASSFNTKSGQRLFPAIMLGANIGALAGAQVTSLLIDSFGPLVLLGLGALVLAATTMLVAPELRAIPDASRAIEATAPAPAKSSVLGGFRVVFSDRYLMLVAAFVVLLNCIGSTGDYLLAHLMRERADALIAAAGDVLSREAIIGSLYARFQFWVTLAGVLLQMFLVSRVFRVVGIRGAVLVLPVISLFVYAAIGFVPIFSMIFVAKVLENSTNYSLMNTTQQALYLPTSPAAKFDGKTTIDTFFWRFGDILQAGLVYVGLNVAKLSPSGFAYVNLVLCAAWIVLAIAIGRRFTSLSKQESRNAPPRRTLDLPPLAVRRGETIAYTIAAETFVDPDPGDVMVYSARLVGGAPLPEWLNFDADRMHVSGLVPHEAPERVVIEIVAQDIDGATATAELVLAGVRG